jgi:3-mercaptopropionate dioxygenase
MGEEFVLDTTVVRTFIEDVQATIAGASSPAQACEALRPRFAELLEDPDWLPAEYRAAAPQSGMGGGIGQWLLYRAADQSLSLFSLVVPPGSETPIHDHLAWGLVGLYRGEQDEEIYARRDGALELVERRSVSIHLLTNDTGCVWRHSFDAESGEARPFRSGYVNVACEDDG